MLLRGDWLPFWEESPFSRPKQVIWERDAKGFFSHVENV